MMRAAAAPYEYWSAPECVPTHPHRVSTNIHPIVTFAQRHATPRHTPGAVVITF